MTTSSLNSVPLSTSPNVVSSEVVSQRTIRVLHLVNGDHYAGAEKVLDLLAGNLGQFGFEVGFAQLKPGCFAEARNSQDAPLFEAPMRGKLDIRPAWSLARLVRDEGYELLHAHTPRGALVGSIVSRLTGVPLAYHIHSATAEESTSGLRNRVNAAIERRLMHRSAALIAVSEAMHAYAIDQGADAGRLTLVRNGVPSLFELPAREKPTGEWVLGAVSLFRPRKGLEDLLEAVARLRREGAPVRLRAVGGFETPEYEQEVKRYATAMKLDNVVDWIGFTRDVPAEMAQMDLFLLPSRFREGLPMVIVEAMAAGVPTIATNTGGIPEAIRDGQDGLLIPSADAADIVHAVRRLMRDDASWSAIRQSAWQRQREQFSDRAMSQQVAKVYRRVLQEHRSDAKVQPTVHATDRKVSVFGVEITDTTFDRAIRFIESAIRKRDYQTRSIYYVNANTLNFAASEPGFREVLNSAEAIYADGTGVRWAARAQGIRLQENVNGTDFTPELFTRLSGNDFSYYLLGASPDSVAKAAAYARENFPGWQQAGFHHGYLDDEEVREEAIAEINAIQPDLLLVGMGNPIQERWIAEHRDQLNVGVCMGVGGLIDYWSGSIRRAHRLLRRCGYEWLGVMFLQPKKAKRYLLGNPMFLIRVALERLGWKKYGPIEAKPASDPHRSRDETAKSARIDSEKCNAQ